MDYKKLGLKCGLEIHQQLNTKKLFCECDSVLRSEEPDFTFERKLHAVAGQSGEIDLAAQYHASQDRDFVYQGYDTNCLVEMDESPPRDINPEALKIVLHISLLLNAMIFPITQVMRKTVIDGSNTSGFQRTVLIAVDGFIETSEGRVGIDSICLEEDSARIVGEKNSFVTYRIDRLGIPLVEIATAPDIKTPTQAKEVALKIGNILRSCNVRRGIGTIRQDVNISIKGGERIEMKGFQDVRNIERAIEFESQRQVGLVNKKKSVSEVRRVLPDGKTKFLRPMPGADRMYPETDLPLLKISRNMVNEARKSLPELKHEVEDKLKREGLTHDLAKLILEGYLEEFGELLRMYPNRSQLIAKMLTLWRREIAARTKYGLDTVEEKLSVDILKKILVEAEKGKIKENQIKPVFSDIIEGIPLEKALKKEEVDLGELEERIMKIIKEKPGLSSNAYMGLVMNEMKGKVSGKEVMEIIRKYVELD